MGAALAIDSEEKVVQDGMTVEEVIDFAKDVIRNYFADKRFYGGGKIPDHVLTAKKRVNLVLDCTFDMAMDIAYEALEQELTEDDHIMIKAGGVSPDIKDVISVLSDLSSRGVPQELSNGMLVLYLELVMGANVVYV